MTEFMRRPLFAVIAGFLVLLVLLGSFPIVPETKQAVVVRFGKPVRILNHYEAGLPIGPPYRLVDNENTWLDATDLVFIDPVGTGYSRPAQGEKGDQFYGVEEDVRSIASVSAASASSTEG